MCPCCLPPANKAANHRRASHSQACPCIRRRCTTPATAPTSLSPYPYLAHHTPRDSNSQRKGRIRSMVHADVVAAGWREQRELFLFLSNQRAKGTVLRSLLETLFRSLLEQPTRKGNCFKVSFGDCFKVSFGATREGNCFPQPATQRAKSSRAQSKSECKKKKSNMGQGSTWEARGPRRGNTGTRRRTRALSRPTPLHARLRCRECRERQFATSDVADGAYRHSLTFAQCTFAAH